MAKRSKRQFVRVDDAPGPGMSRRGREAVALILIGVSLYLLVSLVSFALPEPGHPDVPRGGGLNLGGVFGYLLATGFLFVLGYAAYILVVFALVHGVLLFLGRQPEKLVLKTLGAVVFAATVALLLAGPSGLAGMSESAPWGAGGRLGANLSPKLSYAFGGSGRILLLIFGALFGLLLATEWMFSALLRGGLAGLGSHWQRAIDARAARAELTAAADEEEEEEYEDEEEDEYEDDEEEDEEEYEDDEEYEDEEEEDEDEEEEEEEDEDEEEPAPEVDEEVTADEVQALEAEAPPVEIPKPPPPAPKIVVRKPRRRKKAKQPRAGVVEGEYPFPPIELFSEPEVCDDAATQEIIERNARAIERRLGSFKVGARVVGVSQGPAVTQYELSLAEGIKVSRVNSFEADLAAALKALSVRVVAPIPGRDTVGVEVPNATRQTVLMRELLELFGRADKMAIPLFLGKDVAGDPIVEDLARMPHLLIAGTTGSGKSVCINSILLSILMTRAPNQVRLILIDPKMVELQHYKNVPHLSCDVVSNMKKAPGVLEWAVEEMEKRYALLSAVGVNHIRSYNKLGAEELEKRLQRPREEIDVRLPYQVVVIDELADLMAVSQKEIEEYIQRLAQKSRAVGLHVIIATQRPSTDVITGVIKANLPCQIAFKVNRKIDSRVILDANGAEKLLGHGDMLYVPPGAHQLMRAQATFVAEDEMLAVVNYLDEHGPKPSFIPDLVQTKTGKKRSPRDRDDMFEQAVEVVLGQQRGSATLLQRALSVGYTRATRLLEMMEEEGVVGPFVGSKSRDVLMTLEEWQAREQAIADELEALEEGDDGEEWEEDGDEADDQGDEGETPRQTDGSETSSSAEEQVLADEPGR